MRKFLSLCVLLTTVCTASLFARNELEHQQVKLTGEYLYLMPSVDDTYFVIKSPTSATSPQGVREHNDFDFHSGYRVGAAYAFSKLKKEFRVAYTYLNCDQSEFVTGNHLSASIGSAAFINQFENYAGTASSELHLLYQRLDAVFAQRLLKCCRFDCDALFGLEGAYLRLNEDNKYQAGATIGHLHRHSRTRAIGPQVGLALDYKICKRHHSIFSFNVVGTGGLLAGRTDTSCNELANVEDQGTWRMVPAIHVKAGFNYDLTFHHFGMVLGVGYEFNSYIRGLTRQNFPDNVAVSMTNTQYYNFDLQGLYVSGTFKF